MIRLLKPKARLLVLDDDPSMQRLIAALLRRRGYRVDVVSSGKAAIEKVNKNEYGALLLDIMTPTEGGMTVIRHLRKANPGLVKRVILVTASPSSVLASVSKDVATIVYKPFQPEELLAAIEAVIGESGS